MTPDRLQQIQELFRAVQEGSAEERSALLARADPDLRGEVESLLARLSESLLLDRPAVQAAMQWMDTEFPAVTDGTRLGPYRIDGRLGEGGMGKVFRAVDTRLGRAVAIKIAHAQFSDRFEREARTISALNHANICTLYDVGPNYLVMELVQGETLAAQLKSGPLPIQAVLSYGCQIAAALVEAHGAGIIHRDLKPGNIMIGKSGVKVLDFGLARSDQNDTVTASHMIMGTPAYMAPEQREGKTADARTDIYAFGCVLFEMLTGTRAGPKRKRIPSRKLAEIVNRCLEEDPARRWQSMADLQRKLAGGTATGTRGKRMLAAAAGTLVLFPAAYFYFHRLPKLTDKDTIVLADFVNNTGDPLFDGTLRQALAVQLEQSPFLKIMDDGQVQRVLRLMNVPPGAHISNQIAQEICLREDAASTINGTIATLGRSYVITLQAIACPNAFTLAREQIQAEDKEHVLNAVGRAVTAIRGKLGEPHNSIQKLNRPLEQATTPSLEALQNYSEAYSQMSQGHFLETVPLFERAIAIDPNFAMAYFFLGVLFEQAGDMGRSADYAKKAFGLVDRVSDYERAQINSNYYHANGESDKEIDANQLGIRKFPRDWIFHNALSANYIDRGEYEDGLREGLEAVRLQANVEPAYRRVLDAYICLDRLPEANQLAQKLRALGLDGVRIHQRFLEMAYLENDQAAIDREVQWSAGKPGEYLSLGLQAAKRDVHGRRREAHTLYRRAAEEALRRGFRNAASEFEEADARSDALVGRCQAARRLGRPALALAMCGDAAHAEKLAAETSKLFPNGTIWNVVQLPGIRAAIALNRDQPARSVELLAPASPYERSYLDAVYLRGLAYLRLHKGAEAAAEFQKIVDHKGANWGSRWQYPYWGQFYSLSYLGMARCSALAGDTANARKAFKDFFELWKDAEADIPVLKQAKTEYAKLVFSAN
jgi:eukaryotic-like serine/threonine-protein kinase